MIGNLTKRKKFLVIVTTFLLAIILFVSACGIGRVTKSNYDKIQTGMSFSEVVEILGDDYEASSDASFGGYSSSCYIWEGSFGANITIIFLNNKVYTKAQTGL